MEILICENARLGTRKTVVKRLHYVDAQVCYTVCATLEPQGDVEKIMKIPPTQGGTWGFGKKTAKIQGISGFSQGAEKWKI